MEFLEKRISFPLFLSTPSLCVVYVYIHVYVHTCIQMYICTHVHICVQMYMCASVCICVQMYMCMCRILRRIFSVLLAILHFRLILSLNQR